MIHIDRLKVAGFKSIREMRTQTASNTEREGLPLSDLNVLIGVNGAGKSNLLSFFNLIQAMNEGRLQLFVGTAGGANRLLYYGRKVTERISATIELRGRKLFHEWKLKPSADEALVFEAEKLPNLSDNLEFESELLYYQNPNSLTWGDVPGPPSLLDGGRPGSREAKGLFHDNPTANKLRERFDLASPLQVYHFSDTGEGSPPRQTTDLDDNRILRTDGRNIAPVLHLLKHKSSPSYDAVVQATKLAFPFFEDFRLAPSELDQSRIKLEWKESGTDDYRDASYLSDGALRFMCLATLLLQPKPGLILIDEPELGLHPYALGILAELVRAASTDRQVIVSTQSVTLVNQFDPEEVVVVERQHEPGSARYETAFKRLDGTKLREWLEDYRLGDLWEKNVIGGRP